jgi:hypothetical protein
VSNQVQRTSDLKSTMSQRFPKLLKVMLNAFAGQQVRCTSKQSGATHFRPEINNVTEVPEIAQGDAQRFRWSASALHLKKLNGYDGYE